MDALNFKISGIVQGVGFRPYTCKLAKDLSLKGWILNNSFGVEIHIEGNSEDLFTFKNTLKNNPPKLAKINEFIYSKAEVHNYSDFSILESKKTKSNYIFFSPDVCTCDECKNEILDKSNSRYYYPFTNCTNCGPRFSIIKEIPYDRKFTTMKEFEMCPDCIKEYTDIFNRRFHAQPNCCPNCGPKLYILNSNNDDITDNITNNAKINSIDYNKSLFSFFQKSISKGDIWAVKSLGGFHLCCDPTNKNAINALRQRKNRPKKPLALMMKDIETIKKYCFVSNLEKEQLLSEASPIVLLKKKPDFNLPDNIASNNDRLGVMLPSTPFHILLFNDAPFDSLIMTSANLTGLPLEYQNSSVVENLSNMADYYFMNNRDIVLPLDDSIVKQVNNTSTVIRRSKGYVPKTINLKHSGDILALGADMKNTFSMSKGDFIYMGPQFGSINNYESVNRLKSTISIYKKLFELEPKAIACDLHPNYETTRMSKSFNLPVYKIQHHHAHIVSCMIDNNFYDNVIGVAFDGTGYGTDKTIWGSEFLLCNLKRYVRVGHLDYINFLGSDNALRDGYKIALSYLMDIKDSNYKNIIDTLTEKYYYSTHDLVEKLLKYSQFSYNSCSMGRLFDGVASLLGLCQHSTFEGEAAIALESILTSKQTIEPYYYKIKDFNSMYILSPTSIIKHILRDIENNVDKSVISLRFHSTIVDYIVNMCVKLRHNYEINTVALSGGVFQNTFLLENTYNELRNKKFQVLIHKNIPCNDSGISVGQIVIAKYKQKDYNH